MHATSAAIQTSRSGPISKGVTLRETISDSIRLVTVTINLRATFARRPIYDSTVLHSAHRGYGFRHFTRAQLAMRSRRFSALDGKGSPRAVVFPNPAHCVRAQLPCATAMSRLGSNPDTAPPNPNVCFQEVAKPTFTADIRRKVAVRLVEDVHRLKVNCGPSLASTWHAFDLHPGPPSGRSSGGRRPASASLQLTPRAAPRAPPRS